MVDDSNGRPWYQDPKFLALRKQWYGKLKKRGFHDMELHDWSTGESYECLDGISQADVKRTYTRGQERYYQLAVQWVLVMRKRLGPRNARDLDLPQTVRRDVRIWKMHADGAPNRLIGEKLRISKGTAATVIRRERELMLREYREGGYEGELDEPDDPGDRV